MFAKMPWTQTPLLTLALTLTACTAATPPDLGDTLPPLRTVLDCLPKEAALVAAHRGTGAGLGAPENSLSGLDALVSKGVLMAEIDVAKVRDGTLITFHDGVWDDKASGSGPVVSTNREAFSKMRLRDRKGGAIGGEAVPTLAQMLDRAKDRIYLELDFKSSADIDRVVRAVRERDMADQVVLIATDTKEAKTLRPYASEFVLSLPRARQKAAGPAQTNQKHGVWIGGRWREGAHKKLDGRYYVFGQQWKKNPDTATRAARALDVLVTDQPLRFAPITHLKTRPAFEACVRATNNSDTSSD